MAKSIAMIFFMLYPPMNKTKNDQPDPKAKRAQ